MTKVKICGITNEADALYAASCGASMLGFIFYPDSKRYISFDKAKNIISKLPENITPVGVFVHPTAEFIQRAISITGIKAVQLHGDRPDDLEIPESIVIIKAYSVDSSFDFTQLDLSNSDLNLLDTKVNGQYGGTGKSFDWLLIPDTLDKSNLMLAGGLNPQNVREAVQMVRPALVDVSGGVEKSAGIKSHRKIKEFIDIVEKTVNES